MKSLRLSFVVVACLLFAAIYFSCNKVDNPGPGSKPVEYVSAGISGRVTDESKLPVQGALITAGTASTTTDINGEFTINSVSLDKNAGFVKAEKDGYFLGSRTFTVSENVKNHVTIQLIKKDIAGNFNSGTGGLITVPSGGSINFQGAGIVNATTQAAYAGTVNVSAFFINPAASNFRDIMPGALRGINQNNQETGLQSYGMMAVELTGAGGEKLQLSSSKTATVTFPIPASFLLQAPATIPLWSFDEITGLWKQEGSATKQGSNYVGTVSHFSFWNCDAPFPVVDFTAVFKDQNSNPLPGLEVILKFAGDSSSVSGYGITDATGRVTGKVPGNKSLQLFAYNKCKSLIHTQTVGPFTGTTDMGVITITNPGNQSLTISGTVINCNGGAVTNGFVNVFLEGLNYRTAINNGNFSIAIVRCDDEPASAQLLATDEAGNQQGAIKNVNVTAGTANAGQLIACGVSTNQFINYAVNGANYSLAPPDSLYAFRQVTTTYIQGSRSSQNDYRYFNLSFEGNASAGITSALNYIDVYVNHKSYIKSGTINVNLTEYGQPGEYISGNFEGSLRDSTNATVTVPITCTFRVKRLQ